MNDVQKLAVRDKILRDIVAEGINPECNKTQIAAAIDAVANFRSVAANRKIMDDLFDAKLPQHMRARVFTAVFAVEEQAAKDAHATEQAAKIKAVTDGKP